MLGPLPRPVESIPREQIGGEKRVPFGHSEREFVQIVPCSAGPLKRLTAHG